MPRGLSSPKITRAFGGRRRTAVEQSVGAGCCPGGTPFSQMRHMPRGGRSAGGTSSSMPRSCPCAASGPASINMLATTKPYLANFITPPECRLTSAAPGICRRGATLANWSHSHNILQERALGVSLSHTCDAAVLPAGHRRPMFRTGPRSHLHTPGGAGRSRELTHECSRGLFFPVSG